MILVAGGFWLIASSLSLGRTYHGRSAGARRIAACLLGVVAGVVITALFVLAVGLSGVNVTMGAAAACFFIIVGSSLLAAVAIAEIGAKLTIKEKGD